MGKFFLSLSSIPHANIKVAGNRGNIAPYSGPFCESGCGVCVKIIRNWGGSRFSLLKGVRSPWQ